MPGLDVPSLQLTVLQRILDALYRPIKTWWIRTVTARSMSNMTLSALTTTPTVGPWCAVGDLTELLITIVQQNATTGSATAVVLQFQVMDPLNGAAVNFGATIPLAPVASAGTIGITSTTLTGFGGFIRTSVTATVSTLSGFLVINYQGK